MRTALHFATNGPHEAAIGLLLERGANPNIRCEGDWAFPLHFVAEKGRLDLVQLLVEHGADPVGTGDYHELDVIGWATAFDYVTPSPGLVDYLLAHGARHTIFSAVATGAVDGSAARHRRTRADRTAHGSDESQTEAASPRGREGSAGRADDAAGAGGGSGRLDEIAHEKGHVEVLTVLHSMGAPSD